MTEDAGYENYDPEQVEAACIRVLAALHAAYPGEITEDTEDEDLALHTADMLCDFMHFAQSKGWEFENLAGSAAWHFSFEHAPKEK